ncbi:MAG: TlyA family RNA methyltransferase [Pseudomonadota bacterium]
MDAKPFIRLDHALVERGLAPNRSRARDMVARGCVRVGNIVAAKPGLKLAPGDHVHVDDPAARYVSRAALKLVEGLAVSGFDPQGCHCLDLGSSTGGFTQVLLERGAASVLAVDVGHGQMVEHLAQDDRVTLREGVNARKLTAEDLRPSPNFIVSDMSFISLTKGAEAALRLCAPAAKAILLVKPQFEVGRDGVGKGGLVSDQTLLTETLERVRGWFGALPGWREVAFVPSPITGSDGNVEYLLCGERHAILPG